MEKGVSIRIFEEEFGYELQRLIGEEVNLSSPFVAWQGEGKGTKGRIVTKFSSKSKNWKKKTVKMENMQFLR